MHDYERIHYIHNTIKRAGVVKKNEIMEHFGVSRSAVQRDIAFMRHRLRAPIEFRKTQPQGYIYNAHEKEFELAGVWLTAPACHALVVMKNLLDSIVPPTAGYDPFHAISAEIANYLHEADYDPSNFLDKITFMPCENRPQNPTSFHNVLKALLDEHRLSLTYHSRSKNQITAR
ncbi:HTH domain-containing protein, partial [Myxococcota bacterium]|nr:HTH domain-containing protein [Myxococcota bacterium]MBU1537307.1 HTH domain-containing protein [Myxococcota bacterium]